MSQLRVLSFVHNKHFLPGKPLGTTVGFELISKVLIHAIWDIECLVWRHAIERLCGGNFSIAKWCPMSSMGVLLVGRTPRDVRVDNDQCGTFRFLASNLKGVLKSLQIVGIRHAGYIPTVCDKTCCNVLAEGPSGVALNGDVVIVPNPA